MRFKFNTSLDILDCQSRLRENIAKPGETGTESHPLIKGSVRKHAFTLWILNYMDVVGLNLLVKDPFRPICFGKLLTNQGHTIISGRIGTHPFVIGFFSLWFAGVAIIGGTGITSVAIALAAGRSNTDNLLIACMVTGGLLICGLVMMFGFRGSHKEESDSLIRIIKAALEVSD
jgi:hypothetical protein